MEEPGEADAILMMRGLVDTLERHHGVRILEEAVEASVRLSHRYISGRQLPDKSISLLDTACARVAVSRAATPAAVEDVRRRIEQLDVELRILGREQASGGDHAKTLAEREAAKATAEAEREGLEARWAEEKGLIDRLAEQRQTLQAAHGEADDAAREGARAELMKAPRRAGGDPGRAGRWCSTWWTATPWPTCWRAWTGIPVGRMVSDDIKGVLGPWRPHGRAAIRGQPQAIAAIAEAMRVARAGLADPNKPIGVFLMCGTSGVGKTETALTLADLLYGGPQALTVINMSEFKEEHKVSMLVGSPPGYVGYGEGGVLTEAVRRRPFGVILLDEMEKAHPGVQDVFYQVFDKGQLRDGQGRDIDFRNTLIIMTSNAGTETIEKLFADPETLPDAARARAGVAAGASEDLQAGLPRTGDGGALRPPAARDHPRDRGAGAGAGPRPDRFHLRRELRLEPAGRRRHRRPPAPRPRAARRNIEAILNQTVVPALAGRMLSRMIEQKPAASITLSVDEGGEFGYQIL